jgi:hypothetical protein
VEGGRKSRKGHKGRALMNGTIDQYDPTLDGRNDRVFERDNWICGRCGVKTTREGGYPSPRYPTIGHKLAMILGGAHTWDNVQCECWECNIGAGNEEKRLARELGLEYDVDASHCIPCVNCGEMFVSRRRRTSCGCQKCKLCGNTFRADVKRSYCDQDCEELAALDARIAANRRNGAKGGRPREWNARCEHIGREGKKCMRKLSHKGQHNYIIPKGCTGDKVLSFAA